MDMLSLQHVYKSFSGHEIIKDLCLNVREHTIYGFIGQNGAGKTTTMKMITGLYKADAGDIFINGEKVTYGNNKTSRFTGYLPDVPEFYNYMTPKEYLHFCGEITGIKEDILRTRIPELIELVGLTKADKKINGFSRGMKQRLGIAQALINKPKLLICDEPTSALDPVGRKEITDILLDIKNETTVIFSTHILSDVEKICDDIGLLNNGCIQIIENRHESNGFLIEFKKQEDVNIFLQKFAPKDITGCKGLTVSYTGYSMDKMAYAMSLMTELQICPVKFERIEPSLESLFMEVVQE